MKRQTEMVFHQHGGPRRGSGPKKHNRYDISHHPRPFHDDRTPVHVMLRVRGDVPGLRQRRLYHAIRAALRTIAKRKDEFRVVHVSIQSSHLHLIVESSSTRSLSHGMQALAISAAKRINNALGRRGSIFEHRYKSVPLASPTQTRAAVLYTLNNWRKHGEDRGWSHLVDWYSSGPRFWQVVGPVPDEYVPLETSSPTTWSLRNVGELDPRVRPKGTS